MHKCILCPNSTQKNKNKKNVTYHSFPIKLERRKKWLKNLKLDNCFQWHRICSDHFDEKDFKPGYKRLLWPFAVPKLPLSLETFNVTRNNIKEHFSRHTSTSLESSSDVTDIDTSKNKRTTISSKLQRENLKTKKCMTPRRSSRRKKYKTLKDELRSRNKHQNKRVITDTEMKIDNTESVFETCSSNQWSSNEFTNGLRCSINNCKAKNTPNISFFGFPRDESIRKIWIQNCGLDDSTNSQDKLIAKLKVCRLHFEDNMFTNVLKKNRLIPNAIPTLFLNNDFMNDDIDNSQQTTSNYECNIEVNNVPNSHDDSESVITSQYQSSTIITENPTQLQQVKSVPNVYFTDENGQYKCCVPECKQRNPSELTSLFTPPAVFLSEWSSLLDLQMTKESCVCDKHFKTQDIIFSEMDVPNKGKKIVKRLAEYAMPISVKTNKGSSKRSIVNNDLLIKKPRTELIGVSKTPIEVINLSEDEIEEEYINRSSTSTLPVYSSEVSMPTTSNFVQSSFEKVLPKILTNSSISLTLQPSVNQNRQIMAKESIKVVSLPTSIPSSDNLSQNYDSNVLPTYASKLTLINEPLNIILTDEESSNSSESIYEEISKHLANKSLAITRESNDVRNKQLSGIVSTEVLYSADVPSSSKTKIKPIDDIQPTTFTNGSIRDLSLVNSSIQNNNQSKQVSTIDSTEDFDSEFGIKYESFDDILLSDLNDASSTTYGFSQSNKESLLLKTLPNLNHNLPSNSNRPVYFNSTKACVKKIVQESKVSDKLPTNNVVNPEFINNLVSISPNSAHTSQSAEIYLPVSNCISLNMETQNLEFNQNSNSRVLQNDVIFIHMIRREVILPNIFWKTLRSTTNKNLTVFVQRDELLEVIKQVIFSTSLVPHININGRHYDYNKSIRTKLELENLLEKIDDIQICKGYDGYVHKQCYYYFEDTNSLKNELCDKCKELVKKELLYKVDTIIQHKSNTVEHLISKISELEDRVLQARNRMLQQKRKGNIKSFLKTIGPIEILSGLKPLQY